MRYFLSRAPHVMTLRTLQVRCERASAVLMAGGYNAEVVQLQGGVHRLAAFGVLRSSAVVCCRCRCRCRCRWCCGRQRARLHRTCLCRYLDVFSSSSECLFKVRTLPVEAVMQHDMMME